MAMTDNVTRPWHKVGKWVQCGITGMAFPPKPLTITFRGQTLYLIPGKPKNEGNTFGDLYPVVAFEHSEMSFEDGQRLISAFINSVAWMRGERINTALFGGGSRVHGLGGQDAKALVDDRFELNDLPELTEEKACLSLAFYREGLNLNSVAYQCLSFFKILNIAFSSWKDQVAWIDANIADARQRDAWRTRDWEEKAGFDPTKTTAGGHLYVSNPCAIAHAYADPLINPDDPVDRQRLENDLPMVKALAEHFIEKEFGVKSASTISREHLFELQGFSDLFGAALVARIKADELVPLEDFPVAPILSIRLAHMTAFKSFEGMQAEYIDCHSGKVNLMLTAITDRASALMVLDFAAERLDFEIFEHLFVDDDGSVAGAQAVVDYRRFVQRYLCNGKLELWSGSSRMSQRSAFIPHNIDLGATLKAYEAEICAAEERLQARVKIGAERQPQAALSTGPIVS